MTRNALAAILVIAALALPAAATAQTPDVCGPDNVCELGVRVWSGGLSLLTEGSTSLFEVFIKDGKRAPADGLHYRAEAFTINYPGGSSDIVIRAEYLIIHER